MTQIVQMSTEQLQQLIEAVRLSAVNVAQSASEKALTIKTKGSFANCNTRFDGQRDHEAVEEFITAVVTYKEVESISDEDALKSISLLFSGIASTWWQGVRKEAKTWNDAIEMIRDHFSPTKPAYQIYVEIFDTKQADGVAIDTFICEKRALLAQLPDGRHNEETELDFVFGLLNIKYRKHIKREDVKTFRDLLEKGRVIEYTEDEVANPWSGMRRGGRRCTFCNYRGHTYENCRKRTDDNRAAN